ncbi:hypothetical protein KKC06_02705 [Patescibacteria group bacterium]|nr:hypothetical protein [Patescibacteria group bacterium]
MPVKDQTSQAVKSHKAEEPPACVSLYRQLEKSQSQYRHTNAHSRGGYHQVDSPQPG